MLKDIADVLKRLAENDDVPRQLAEIKIVEDTRIEDLQLDSLATSIFLAEVSELVGGAVPDDLVFEVETVGELASRLDEMKKQYCLELKIV